MISSRFKVKTIYLKTVKNFLFLPNTFFLSVAIAFNIPNLEDPICFVSEGNQTVLVQKMVNHVEKISDAAYAILQERYKYVFDALAISPNYWSKNLLKEFDAFTLELPILGYNSSQ